MTEPGELGDITATGVQQEATPGIQQIVKARFERLLAYHTKAGTHFWTVVAQHMVSDEALELIDASVPPVIYLDTLLGVHIGCFICEEPYTSQLRLRRCPGDPR